MTLRSCTRFALMLAAVASARLGYGQTPAPAEVRALPVWAGEENAATSLPAHFVFRDANGQIVVSYPKPEGGGRRITYRFWLPNRVDPHVRISITKRDESGRPTFTYTYKLSNGHAAASAITQWSIVGPEMEEIAVEHPIWKGYNARVPVAPQTLVPDAPAGAFLMWGPGASKLDAGSELGDFTVRSRFLPGLTTAYASGEGVLEEPDGEFPEAVTRVLTLLQRPHVWQKPFLTVGPRFAPETPVSAIFDAFRKDVARLLIQGLLHAESPYVRELQELLAGTGSTAVAITSMRASPESPVETELNDALRVSASAAR